MDFHSLTIYLLVRFFGLDSPNLNANLWSTLLGMGELGMFISIILAIFPPSVATAAM
jgi:hypothetical protein